MHIHCMSNHSLVCLPIILSVCPSFCPSVYPSIHPYFCSHIAKSIEKVSKINLKSMVQLHGNKSSMKWKKNWKENCIEKPYRCSYEIVLEGKLSLLVNVCNRVQRPMFRGFSRAMRKDKRDPTILQWWLPIGLLSAIVLTSIGFLCFFKRRAGPPCRETLRRSISQKLSNKCCLKEWEWQGAQRFMYHWPNVQKKFQADMRGRRRRDVRDVSCRPLASVLN